MKKYMKEPRDKSISATKVWERDDDDPLDTLEIRNCYDLDNDYHKLFGIKGESSIHSLLYVILKRRSNFVRFTKSIVMTTKPSRPLESCWTKESKRLAPVVPVIHNWAQRTFGGKLPYESMNNVACAHLYLTVTQTSSTMNAAWIKRRNTTITC